MEKGNNVYTVCWNRTALLTTSYTCSLAFSPLVPSWTIFHRSARRLTDMFSQIRNVKSPPVNVPRHKVLDIVPHFSPTLPKDFTMDLMVTLQPAMNSAWYWPHRNHWTVLPLKE